MVLNDSRHVLATKFVLCCIGLSLIVLSCGSQSLTSAEASGSADPLSSLTGLDCDISSLPEGAEVDFTPAGMLAGRFDGMLLIESFPGREAVVGETDGDIVNPIVKLDDYQVVRDGVVTLPDGKPLSEAEGSIEVVFDPAVLEIVREFVSDDLVSGLGLNVVDRIPGIFDHPYVNAAYAERGDRLILLAPCTNMGAQAELDSALDRSTSDGVRGRPLERLAGPLRDDYLALDPSSIEVPQPSSVPGELAADGVWLDLTAEVETGRQLGTTAICFRQEGASRMCSMDDAIDGRLIVVRARVDEGAPLQVEFVTVDEAGDLGDALAATQLDVAQLRARDDLETIGEPPTPRNLLRLDGGRGIDIEPTR